MRALAIAALLGVIAATPAARAESPSLPAGALAVPAVWQATDYSCGPASLLAVLRYWRVFDGDERDLYRPLHTSRSDGTEPEPMARHARRLGLDAVVRHDLTLGDLRAALGRGATVILDLQAWRGEGAPTSRPWRSDWADGHYVVLVALDDRYVYAMDPSAQGGYAYLTVDELLARWHDVERVRGRDVRRQHMAIIVSGASGPDDVNGGRASGTKPGTSDSPRELERME